MGNCCIEAKETYNFCGFVRHGESVDEALAPKMVIPRSEMKEFDPPLTKLGVAQSIITGQYLKVYFESELDPTKIVIRSSPFIRCIMTACIIASQLGEGKLKAPTVVIDGNHAELLTG